MQLFDLVDGDDLDWLVRNGYVRQQTHPTEPLNIVSYTDKAQVEGETFWREHLALWNCRGLIYNIDSGEIVARPFRKFWNHGQGAADKFDDFELVHVTDKLDGSLGIMYREPNGGQLAIATRGSFTSDQALHATHLLRTRYSDIAMWGPEDPRGKYSPADDETFLFEIIYPENRIVVNYDGTDDLFLLGSVDLETGWVSTPHSAASYLDWYGPQARMFDYVTFKKAMEATPRPNAEGIVVSNTGGNRMVKIKQDDYIALHKIVTGLSERRVWEALVAGQTPAQICEPLPDEFHVWVLKVAGEMLKEHRARLDRILMEFNDTIGLATLNGWVHEDDGDYVVTDRKQVALLFKESEDAWALFALLDGRGIREKLWKQLEPKGDVGPNTYKEV